MRILFLAVDIDLRNDRGDSVHVRELCANLVAIGHEVVLITGTPGLDSVDGAKHLTARATTFGQVRQALGAARGWADVVYERRVSPKLSWLVSVFSGTPFALEVNGVLEDERISPGQRVAAPRLKAWIRGLMIRRARRIVTVSRGIRDSLLDAYRAPPDKVVVIPNGANIVVFTPRNRDSCRSELGLRADDHVLCFVGNLVGWQGVRTLLDAVAAVARYFSTSTLLIVGDGPERASLEAHALALGISDSARFVGKVPYAEVPRYVCAADVCIAPFQRSRKASPIKVFEYLACGVPVVVSNVDEVGEFVRSTKCGLVVEPDDPGALAEAIRWVFDHPAEAAAEGRRGREVVLRERSWKETARRVTECLSKA